MDEVKTSFALVVDPKTFQYVLVERKFRPLTKRTIDPLELNSWTEEQFRSILIDNGYSDLTCTGYIEQANVKFARDDE